MFCWHKWSDWQTFGVGMRSIGNGHFAQVVMQYRSCSKCGKVKKRMAG